MYTVYLVGQITIDPMTYEWRREVEDYFKTNEQVKIIKSM